MPVICHQSLNLCANAQSIYSNEHKALPQNCVWLQQKSSHQFSFKINHVLHSSDITASCYIL